MLNRNHVMTTEDRNVLAKLLDKINAIHSMRDHKKYVFFLKKAIEEAERRNSALYRDRFHTMLISSQLSRRAFDTRLSSRGIVAVAGDIVLQEEAPFRWSSQYHPKLLEAFELLQLDATGFKVMADDNTLAQKMTSTYAGGDVWWKALHARCDELRFNRTTERHRGAEVVYSLDLPGYRVGVRLSKSNGCKEQGWIAVVSVG